MKAVDIIFALVTGKIIGMLAGDFLAGTGVATGFYYFLIVWVFFPLFSLFCLWIAYQLGKRWLFIFQVAKHLLVGAFVTVIDLKIFEFLIWFFVLSLDSTAIKGLSFIVATLIKYWGNKYWAFNKQEKENLKKELGQFFLITSVGLLLDVIAFDYFTNMGPQLGLSVLLWTKLAVVLAGCTAAAWNFIGYKFWVFRK